MEAPAKRLRVSDPGPAEAAAAVPPPTPAPLKEFNQVVLARNKLAPWANTPLLAKMVTGMFVCVSGRNISPLFEPDVLLCKIVGVAPPSSEEYTLTSEGSAAVKTRSKLNVQFLPLKGRSLQVAPVRLSVVSNQPLHAVEYARFCAQQPQNVLDLGSLMGVVDEHERVVGGWSSGKCCSVVSPGGPVPWGSHASHRTVLLLRSWLHPAGDVAVITPAPIHTIDIPSHPELCELMAAAPEVNAAALRAGEHSMSVLFKPCLDDGSSTLPPHKYSGEFSYCFMVGL